MSKLSIVLNSLAVILSLVAFGFTQMTISDHQNSLNNIFSIKEKMKNAKINLDEQMKETASKLLLQKNRNQDLSDEIVEFKKKSQEVAENLSATKIEISGIEKSIEDRKAQLVSVADRKLEASEELSMRLTEIQDLRNEIPKIEQQIDIKKFEIRDFEERSTDLQERLAVYSSITATLRQHYLDTTSAIRSYARKRPWIERGEELSIKLGPIDLVSGYVALSEGGEVGLRENMVFAVHALGEEISKIRIKKVFRTHSLAELIPLVGNPLKLQASTQVDLVAL